MFKNFFKQHARASYHIIMEFIKFHNVGLMGFCEKRNVLCKHINSQLVGIVHELVFHNSSYNPI